MSLRTRRKITLLILAAVIFGAFIGGRVTKVVPIVTSVASAHKSELYARYFLIRALACDVAQGETLTETTYDWDTKWQEEIRENYYQDNYADAVIGYNRVASHVIPIPPELPMIAPNLEQAISEFC